MPECLSFENEMPEGTANEQKKPPAAERAVGRRGGARCSRANCDAGTGLGTLGCYLVTRGGDAMTRGLGFQYSEIILCHEEYQYFSVLISQYSE